VILWDNNILGESHWSEVFSELKELGVEADFNQGLDARLMTEAVARGLAGIKLPTIRLAYDFVSMREQIMKAVTILRANLPSRRYRHICCYVLYNYKDTPKDLFSRVRDLLAWGVAAYPMRYQPLSGEHAFQKDSYISPDWTPEELDMVAAARRVIGFGGAFPPYEGLVKKFYNARNFHDAFELRARKSRSEDELEEFAWDLVSMGKDHQFPIQTLRVIQ